MLSVLKKDKQQAFVAKDSVKKSILEVLIGEVQLTESRTNKTLQENEIFSIIRKLIKSNEESLNSTDNDSVKEKLNLENKILSSYLPKTLTKDEILVKINESGVDIHAEKEGAVLGQVMKYFKTNNIQALNEEVVALVKELRIDNS